MKLDVGERVTLLGVLPERASFAIMDTVDKLTLALMLSEEEVEGFAYTERGGKAYWNEIGNDPIEIEISTIGQAFLITKLQEADSNGDLTLERFRLLRRFNKEN